MSGFLNFVTKEVDVTTLREMKALNLRRKKLDQMIAILMVVVHKECSRDVLI